MTTPAPKQTNALALVSLIFSIVGVLQCLPIIGSLVGIITGHLAQGQLKKNPALGGATLALIGVILGYVGFVLSIILGVAFFYFTYIAVKKTVTEVNNQQSELHVALTQVANELAAASTNTSEAGQQESTAAAVAKLAEVAKKHSDPQAANKIITSHLKSYSKDSPLTVEDSFSENTVTYKVWLEGDNLVLLNEADSTTTQAPVSQSSKHIQASILNTLISSNAITDPMEQLQAAQALSILMLNLTSEAAANAEVSQPAAVEAKPVESDKTE